MRPFFITSIAFAAAVAALIARDAPDNRPLVRPPDPDRRERLKQYVAAFRQLSPEAQDRARRLDKELRDENPATRARLTGVMERYAQWLAGLSNEDRRRIEAAPAGPERLLIVREMMERQWLHDLPPARKELLAKASDNTERAKLIDRWRHEERERNQDRLTTLRTAQDNMIPGHALRLKQFRETVERFAKSDLEPKLTPREKKRLQEATARAPGSFGYLHLVWVLSSAHGLTPPGPSEIWDLYREPRRP